MEEFIICLLPHMGKYALNERRKKEKKKEEVEGSYVEKTGD